MICRTCNNDIDALRRSLHDFWHANRQHAARGLARHVGFCEMGEEDFDELVLLLLEMARARQLLAETGHVVAGVQN